MFSSNRVIGILLLLLSLYVWLQTNTFPSQAAVGQGPAFFPRVMASILAILALLLMIINPIQLEKNTLTRTQVGKLIIGIFIMGVYVFSIEWIGFGVATALSLAVWMWLLQVKKWSTILIVSVTVTGIVIFAFEYLLDVPIPHGWLY